MANYGYRILKAKWSSSQANVAFLTGLRIIGIDDVGLVNKITNVISSEFNVNIRSLSIVSNEGIFDGDIMVFVNNTEQLDKLMENLKNINGITSVTRYETNT